MYSCAMNDYLGEFGIPGCVTLYIAMGYMTILVDLHSG